MPKNARDEFGPPKMDELAAVLKSRQIQDQVQGIGNDLKRAGVTQGSLSHLSLAKNDHDAKNAVKKDLTVAQGDRPALSPCDGNLQVKEAGQAMKSAGVTVGWSPDVRQPVKTQVAIR